MEKIVTCIFPKAEMADYQETAHLFLMVYILIISQLALFWFVLVLPRLLVGLRCCMLIVIPACDQIINELNWVGNTRKIFMFYKISGSTKKQTIKELIESKTKDSFQEIPVEDAHDSVVVINENGNFNMKALLHELWKLEGIPGQAPNKFAPLVT